MSIASMDRAGFDAGVHARAITAHFSAAAKIPEDKIAIAINSVLPEDISILKLKYTDENFHSRFTPKENLRIPHRELPREGSFLVQIYHGGCPTNWILA